MDSLELLISKIRDTARTRPDLVAQIAPHVDRISKEKIDVSGLSAARTSIAKQFGRDLEEVAVYNAAVTRLAADDKDLLARLPPHRKAMLVTFAGNDPRAQADRARLLGWS